MNVLKAEKKLAVISALTEGCSIPLHRSHDGSPQENHYEALGLRSEPVVNR